MSAELKANIKDFAPPPPPPFSGERTLQITSLGTGFDDHGDLMLMCAKSKPAALKKK